MKTFAVDCTQIRALIEEAWTSDPQTRLRMKLILSWGRLIDAEGSSWEAAWMAGDERVRFAHKLFVSALEAYHGRKLDDIRVAFHVPPNKAEKAERVRLMKLMQSIAPAQSGASETIDDSCPRTIPPPVLKKFRRLLKSERAQPVSFGEHKYSRYDERMFNASSFLAMMDDKTFEEICLRAVDAFMWGDNSDDEDERWNHVFNICAIPQGCGINRHDIRAALTRILQLGFVSVVQNLLMDWEEREAFQEQ